METGPLWQWEKINQSKRSRDSSQFATFLGVNEEVREVNGVVVLFKDRILVISNSAMIRVHTF